MNPGRFTTAPRTSIDRAEASERLPIGVATMYRVLMRAV